MSKTRIAALSEVLTLATVVVAAPALSDPAASFGTIPREAWLTDGSVNMDVVPDYVQALDREGGAGYVRAADILPDDGRGEPTDGPIAVVDRNRELVGWMVPERGFVPIGIALEDVPRVPVTVYEFGDDEDS